MVKREREKGIYLWSKKRDWWDETREGQSKQAEQRVRKAEEGSLYIIIWANILMLRVWTNIR